MRPNGFYRLDGYDETRDDFIKDEGIDREELLKLRKLGKVKKIELTNKTVINIAVWGLIILPILINGDKLFNNIKSVIIMLYNLCF